MTSFSRALCLAAAALFLALPAKAAVFTTTFSGSNEIPPNASTASGGATLTLDGNQLTVSLDFTGLTAAATAGHIHCCAPTTANAGVAIHLDPLPAATSGTFMDVYDLMDASTYSAAFLSAHGGTAAGAQAALLSAFFATTAYINIHNSVFPAGEIRGQIREVSEPGGAALLVFGLIAAIATRRYYFR